MNRSELVGYLIRFLGDHAAAEDVAQDAGVRFMAAARASDAPLRNARAFLFHIATNAARDVLRRRMVRDDATQALATPGSDDMSPGADHVAIAREQLERVSAAVAALPARPREVLLLARVEGCSHKEIARRLGISPKTSENHLARAMAALATRLCGDGDAESLGD